MGAEPGQQVAGKPTFRSPTSTLNFQVSKVCLSSDLIEYDCLIPVYVLTVDLCTELNIRLFIYKP